MQFKKIVPYKIKRLIPMLGLAGATMFMGGCEKDKPIGPIHDVELTFALGSYDNLFYDDENDVRYPSKIAMEYAADPSVRTVYFVPEGNWYVYDASSIIAFRKVTLEKVLAYSPKFRGKGDFNFAWGEATKVPEDSLWYVAQGWTINKYRDGPGPNTKQR